MNVQGRILSLLLAVLLLQLSGCGESAEVKQLKRLRREGDTQHALDLAVAILRSESYRMDVWGELVYIDFGHARNPGVSSQPFRSVLRASTMCAAMKEHRQKLNYHWSSAVTVAVTELISRSQILLRDIDDSGKRMLEIRDREWEMIESNRYLTDEQRELHRERVERQFLRDGSPTLVDPRDARRIVYTAECYYQLLRMLRAPDHEASQLILDQIDGTLEEWPTYSDLDISFIDDLREEARVDLMNYYTAALNDLEAEKHFTAEHVLYPELHP